MHPGTQPGYDTPSSGPVVMALLVRLLPSFLGPLVALPLWGCLFLAGGMGCAGRSQTAHDELVWVIGANPSNLDPRFGNDAWSDKIHRLLFRSLMRKDRQGNLVLDLATKVERPDDLTVRITLGTNGRFHDGSAVTIADVMYTYRFIQDEKNKSIKRGTLDAIESMAITGPSELTFHLKEPFAPFLESLTLGIVPEHVATSVQTPFNDVLTGSGPYRFISFKKDASIVLEAVANPGPPPLPRLRFRIVPDATVRVLELIHGSADMTQNDIPAHLVEYLAGRKDLKVERGSSTLTKYLVFNHEDPILKDVRVRRALSLAIDRSAIIHHELRGFAAPAESILTPGHWAYLPPASPLISDPQTARRLLDEAGHLDPDGEGPEPRFHLTYRTSLDDVAVSVAGIMRLQLARVGIAVDIQTSEFGVFMADIKQGRFQLFTLTAVGVSDPDWFSYVLHSDNIPPKGANRGRYRNGVMDELLTRGKRVQSQEERKVIYARIQEIIRSDLPILPLWYEDNVLLTRPSVTGFSLSTNGDLQSMPEVVKTVSAATP